MTSRLYKRLVYDDQIATTVSAYLDGREISGQFYIIARAKPGGDLHAVEKAIDEEMAKFLADGPTEKELERVRRRTSPISCVARNASAASVASPIF